MRLLALDASTEACSAAVWIDGRIVERYEEPGAGQAERLLELVGAVMAEAGLGFGALDTIAAGVGPGAFTGVRIGVSVAQGLAFGADRPVVPVMTLEALAWPLIGAAPVLACLDARMAEVYWGLFRADAARGLAALDPPRVGPVGAALAAAAGARGVGRGCAAYPALGAALGVAGDDARALPRARDIAALGAIRFAAGEGQDPAGLAPVYLRDKVALTEAERGR